MGKMRDIMRRFFASAFKVPELAFSIKLILLHYLEVDQYFHLKYR